MGAGMKKIIPLLIIMFALMGCATRYDVNVTGYGGQDSYKSKTYDFALPSAVKTDLEMMKYAGVLERQLNCIGWKRDTRSPDYMITPVFGVVLGKTGSEPRISIGGGFGVLSGGFGSGISLGTYVGSSTGTDSKDMSYLDIKLFMAGKTDEQPVWQAKIFTRDTDLSKTAPVLAKYAVENFGKKSEGKQEFTFFADDESMKGLEGCPVK